MPPVTFGSWAVDRAVELVNLYTERGDHLTGDDLHARLQKFGFPEQELDVAAFGALANDLRDAFRDPDRTARIQRLDALLTRAQPRPRLVEHDDEGPHFHYDTTGEAVDHISSSMLMAIATTVVDQGVDRFGWCAAPNCGRLFCDRSPNGSQRFCSRTCATRVNVRAHRERQRREGTAEPTS